MYEAQRKELAKICHLLYDKNLVSASDGNISIKVSAEHILLTPSGKSKGFVEADEMLVLDLAGNVLEGHGRASKEYPMHRAIYEKRPEAGAIVHTHPVFATAFAMAGKTIPDQYLIETQVMLHGITLAGYAAPGSTALAEKVREKAEGNDAILLQNHGALTIGKNLTDAFEKMEVLESAAKTIIMSKVIGEPVAIWEGQGK